MVAEVGRSRGLARKRFRKRLPKPLPPAKPGFRLDTPLNCPATRAYGAAALKVGAMNAKVEWHPGELVPRVGFIVDSLRCPAE